MTIAANDDFNNIGKANHVFSNLGEAEKVKFSETETVAALAHLDNLLDELDGLRAGVDDPEGFVSLILGFDGRLLEVRLADAIGNVMTNLQLEKKLNDLFVAGNQGVAEMRRDITSSHPA